MGNNVLTYVLIFECAQDTGGGNIRAITINCFFYGLSVSGSRFLGGEMSLVLESKQFYAFLSFKRYFFVFL